jgi:hypothetical protein
MVHYIVFNSGKKADFNAVISGVGDGQGLMYFIASSGTEVIFVSPRLEVPEFIAKKSKWNGCCGGLNLSYNWFRFDFEHKNDCVALRQVLNNAQIPHYFCPWKNSLLLPWVPSLLPSFIRNSGVRMKTCKQVMVQEEKVSE